MPMAGTARPALLLYHLLWQAADWLFPPTCGGCGRNGVRWCEDCAGSTHPIVEPFCQRCGNPIEPPVMLAMGGICSSCASSPPHYLALRSFAGYEGSLQAAIKGLKYKGDMGLGEALSKHLIELYNENQWEIDLVVPVPLGQHRRRERGFNQAALLGRPLAFAIQKPLIQGALWRNRETRSQVGLSAHERRANVTGAFSAREDLVRGKTVLLVDDVTTTGSTISACAQALCEAGAKAVFGMTLARALLKTHTDELPNPTHSNRR